MTRRPTTSSIARADRERRALELRRAGTPYDVIAQQLGLSGKGAAYKIVQRALDASVREPADQLRALELERLDRLLFAVWPAAVHGDLKAVDRALRISERRARLLGLDAPMRAEVIAVDAVDAEIEQLLAQLAAPPETAAPGSAPS